MSVRIVGILALLALASGGAGEESPGVPAPRGAEVPVIERLLDRWRDFSEPLKSLSREERLARVPEFFRDVTLDQLRQVCRECKPEDSRTVRDLVRAKFELDPPAQAEYASFVGDTTLIGDCWLVVARAAENLGGDLEPEVARAIADTLMFQADRPRLALPWKHQLEYTAAKLALTDRVHQRMVEELESPHDSIRVRGVLMAEGSRDSRVQDLLVRQLERAVTDSVAYAKSYPATVRAAASVGGAAALPSIERVLTGPSDLERKRHAIMSLGTIQHPATLSLLLRAYNDGATGIRDSTAVLPPGPDRTLYAALHAATRFLEAYLVQLLQSGPSEDALRAFELLDRASRYGPQVEPWKVAQALKDFALRDLGVDRRRVQSVVERVNNPPDPNWILRELRSKRESGENP